MLVLNTKEAELEICHYAKEGNVVELAVLLMTAREQVALLMSQIRDGSTSNGRISIHQYILSKLEALICEEYKPTSYNEQKKLLLGGKEKKAAFTSVLVLLEFFEMEGDTIEAYIWQEGVNVCTPCGGCVSSIKEELMMLRMVHLKHKRSIKC